ncbi:MAG: PepSY-like domain-containing protein [Granulicella sp.]
MKMRDVTTLAAIISISSLAFAAERSIRRSSLPPAVENALQQQIKGATVKGFTTETENGHQTYEVELIVGGHTKNIEFDGKGNIQEVEEEVAFETLSPQVKAALTTKAKVGTVKKVESLRKQDKLVAYEAQVEKSGKHFEIQVGPNGETLRHEE